MLYKLLLYGHIAAGMLALLTGLMALLARKFGTLHPRMGRIYLLAVSIVVVTAVSMSLLKWNLFLLTIGLFTAYQLYAGKRSLVNKSLHPNQRDWFFWGMGLLNGLIMVAQLQLVLMVFGGIQLLLVANDGFLFIKTMRGKKLPATAWLQRHLGNMLGTFIAVITAALVVNGNGSWQLWLFPTVILVPFIIYWNLKVNQLTVSRSKEKNKTEVSLTETSMHKALYRAN